MTGLRAAAMIRTAVTAVLTFGLPAASVAQESFPNRSIVVILPTAAGGGQDVITRLVAPSLRRLLNQQIIVENRPGANGIIAASAVAKSKPDGHTLLVTGATQGTLHKHFYKPLPYDPDKDIIAIAGFAAGPNVLVVNPNLPVKDIPGLVALARRHPGQLTFASNGVGSGQHLAGELFNHLAGIQMLHVPFKGSGEYLSQIAGGYISVAFASTVATIPLIGNKKLKPLGVTTNKRVDSLPGVPAIAEYKPLTEFEHVNWVGVFAPAQTPAAVINLLNTAIGEALSDPTIGAAMRERGNDPMPMTPADVQAFVRKQGARITTLIAARNIQINP